jgi:hypothetical protein
MSPDSCIHFNGFQNERCEGGVRYMDLVGDDRTGIALRLPCCSALRHELRKRKDLTPVDCPTFLKPSAEQMAQFDADMKAHAGRVKKMLPWIREMKARFPDGTNGDGSDTCPVCGKTIRFTIARCNGHMHAACATEGCIRFME